MQKVTFLNVFSNYGDEWGSSFMAVSFSSTFVKTRSTVKDTIFQFSFVCEHFQNFRVMYESERVSTITTRVMYESERVSTITTRVMYESDRVLTITTRVMYESDRVLTITTITHKYAVKTLTFSNVLRRSFHTVLRYKTIHQFTLI